MIFLAVFIKPLEDTSKYWQTTGRTIIKRMLIVFMGNKKFFLIFNFQTFLDK